MTIEIILLALVSTVRPTSLAAVDALLSAVAPRRLMIVYTAAGLTFTIAVGLLIIGAFQGVDINSGTDRTKGIAEIASGTVALAFALGVLTGRIGGAHADDAEGRRALGQVARAPVDAADCGPRGPGDRHPWALLSGSAQRDRRAPAEGPGRGD